MKSVGMRYTSAAALLALTQAPWFALADVTAPVPAAASISENLAIVRTSDEFQQALKDAVENVVIVDHIDMRTAPIFSSALKSNAAVAGILDDADGLHTRTIRGNCSEPAEGLILGPPRMTDKQCVITIHEDFLEYSASKSVAWVSDLYVQLPGFEKESDNHTTLIGIKEGSLYMSNMTFYGDDFQSRAVEVHDDTRAYCSDCYFAKFNKDRDGAIKVNAGGLLTSVRNTFVNNTVFTKSKPEDKVGGGPHIGIYAGEGDPGCAIVWNCTFGNYSALVEGDVKVENENCMVLSDTSDTPTVFDRTLMEPIGPWQIVKELDPELVEKMPSNQATDRALSPFTEFDFMRETDDDLGSLVSGQAQASGMEPPRFPGLPDNLESYSARTPYNLEDGDDDETTKTAAIAAAVSCLVLMGAAAAFLVMRRRRKQQAKQELDEKDYAAEDAMSKHGSVGVAQNYPQNYPSYTPGSKSYDEQLMSLGAVSTLQNMPSYLRMDSTMSNGAAGKLMMTYNPNVPGCFTMGSQSAYGGLTTMSGATTIGSSVPKDATPVDRLQAQLEWLCTKGGGTLFEYLKVAPHLGRRVGGQGAVVFAQHVNSPSSLYALKFFFLGDVFEVERSAACNDDLRAAMPPVAMIQDNPQVLEAATANMPAPMNEWALPPCIVTEKGESLDEFVARSVPDFFTSLQVMVHVAHKLEQLHEAGWAHRDLKPGNAIWLPSSNSWTLIDFGSAARIGEETELAFTIKYAAPETIKAFKRQEKMEIAQSAVDVWALGVICWELLTEKHFYDVMMAPDDVIAALNGDTLLPSEKPLDEAVDSNLGSGAFRESIFQMLDRNPKNRPTVPELIDTWNSLFPRPITQRGASIHRTSARGSVGAPRQGSAPNIPEGVPEGESVAVDTKPNGDSLVLPGLPREESHGSTWYQV